MEAVSKAPNPTVSFDTSPDRYRHWKLTFDGAIATLAMDVDQDAGLSPDYKLKLNSYDLGVDVELADAIQRLRFEHPEAHAVVITSLKDRVFCAGANIFMLRGSTHAWKVNFCKFTNETRLAMEDASAHSGLKFLAALNGICAGGGYELALACDEILLVDDGNSAVSLPETPLLGVLPGTGGLTRVVDKRKVRRDLADVFATVAEGVKGKRAVEWRLVDAVYPTSQFKQRVAARAQELAATSDRPAAGPGIALTPLDLTSRSFFALIEPGSCFAGTLFDLALAADRSYMLDDANAVNTIALSAMNAGPLKMSNGLTRLETRFLAQPEQVDKVLEH